MPFNPLDIIRRKRQAIGIPAPSGVGPSMAPDSSLFRTPGFNPEAAASALNPEPPPATMLARPSLPVPSPGPMSKEAPYMTRRLPNGQPANLPDIAADALSRPMLPPPAAGGIPGGETAANAAALSRPVGPQSRYQQVEDAKQAYLAGTPGRFKSAAINALQGLAAGLATGRGFGAGIGGAAAGAGLGAIDPRGARERQFEREQLPKIAERFAFEDQDRAAAAAAQKALEDSAYNQARIGDLTGQARSRIEQDRLNREKFEFEKTKPKEPKRYTVDGALVDDQGKVIYQSPKVGQLTAEEAEAERIRREGTTEARARQSLAGRIDSLKQQLTPKERRLVESPTEEDSRQDIAAAQAKWDRIQQRELESIRKDTAERDRASASQIRRGSGGRASQSSGGGRRLSQMDSQKFPGMRFK